MLEISKPAKKLNYDYTGFARHCTYEQDAEQNGTYDQSCQLRLGLS